MVQELTREQVHSLVTEEPRVDAVFTDTLLDIDIVVRPWGRSQRQMVVWKHRQCGSELFQVSGRQWCGHCTIYPPQQDVLREYLKSPRYLCPAGYSYSEMRQPEIQRGRVVMWEGRCEALNAYGARHNHQQTIEVLDIDPANPACFKDKTRQVEKAQAEGAQKKAAAAGKDKGVLDQSKLKWGHSETHSPDHLDNPAECKGCDNLKVAAWAGSARTDKVCLDVNCYRKKKRAKTAADNKQARDNYQALIDEAKAFFDGHWPTLRGPALLCIEAMRRYDIDKCISNDLGIEFTAGAGRADSEKAMLAKISTMDTKELWWLTVSICLYLAHNRDRYTTTNATVARMVKLLTTSLDSAPQPIVDLNFGPEGKEFKAERHDSLTFTIPIGGGTPAPAPAGKKQGKGK